MGPQKVGKFDQELKTPNPREVRFLFIPSKSLTFPFPIFSITLQRSFKEMTNILHLPGVNQEISALTRALSSSEIGNYLKCTELEKTEKDGKAENRRGKLP